MHEFTNAELPKGTIPIVPGAYQIVLPPDKSECLIVWLSVFGQQIGNVKLRTDARGEDGIEYATFEVLARTPWDLDCFGADLVPLSIPLSAVYKNPAPDGSENILDKVIDASITLNNAASEAADKASDLVPWWLKLAVGLGVVVGVVKLIN